jgi:CDP-glucose 4,6-dehydratase
MGGWLCLWLARLGARVSGYSLPPLTDPNLFETLGLADRMESTFGDVRDSGALGQAMAGFRPDIVMHLAAQPLVGAAHEDPVETFDVNLMGTVNVLEAIRTTPGVKSALIVTTDKVYENREWSWGYRETDALGGHEPYGASKACAELAVEAFRRSYFSAARPVGIATIRAGNIIGGGDWAANRLVPDAVRCFGADAPLTLRHPDAIRPWQHVLDPLRGYLMLAQRLTGDGRAWSGPWNFGPAEEDPVRVADVADELVRLWSGGARWVIDGNAARNTAAGIAARETRTLLLSSSQANSHLGWRPAWGLKRALAASVEWYKAHLAHQDMFRFSLGQIALAEGSN